MTTNHITQAMANPEIIVELGRRFKEYRLTYRLTQKEAAEKAGVSLSLQDSGSMYFLLPDENTDVNELVSSPDLMKVIRRDESSDNWYSPMVNLSVPKFKVSEKTDLIETVRALGVTDALDTDLADFSPLTGDKENLYLSKADHAATLEIDENGVTGAAYTELGISETAAEIPDDEIDFVLDRPFLFLVTGQDGSILFSGVVRNIAET